MNWLWTFWAPFVLFFKVLWCHHFMEGGGRCHLFSQKFIFFLSTTFLLKCMLATTAVATPGQIEGQKSLKDGRSNLAALFIVLPSHSFLCCFIVSSCLQWPTVNSEPPREKNANILKLKPSLRCTANKTPAASALPNTCVNRGRGHRYNAVW